MPTEPEIALPENTGVIERDPQPGDYVAGVESGIEYEVNQADGDWSPHIPADDGDYQNGIYMDGQTCTNYGCKHSLEPQLDQKLSLLTPEEIAKLTAHGFIVNGKFTRLSAEYNAIKSGTNGGQIPNQPKGNYAYKPWDSARHDGMVPESLCPFPRLQYQPVFSTEQYFDPARITPEAQAAAAAWLEIFDVKYEIVPTDTDSLQKNLKQAPICILTGCCKPWGADVVPVCGLTTGHCTLLYGLESGVLFKDEDSYQPSLKRLAWGYNVSYAIKGVLYLRRLQAQPVVPPHFTHQWAVPMNFGDNTPDVKALQDFLKLNGVFPANVTSSGSYGLITAKAVLAFQLKYKVADPVLLKANAGHHVATLTLPVLNSLCV